MTSNDHYYQIVYGGFFIVAIAFSFLINRLFLKFVRTLGIRDKDETVIRWSTQSKPAVGGFSFYIIFLLSVICYSIFFDNNQVFLSKDFTGLLVACMLGFLLGLADDAYNTKPMLKLSTQVACACVLLVTGTYINISYLDIINYIVTILWVVGIMNSLNMLDNMDGITSTVSISIILSAISIIWIKQDFESIYFICLIGVMGALFGFLYFNWHPSKMYMGDTGSQFLGVFLAAIGIRYLWNAHSPTSSDLISARNLYLPLIVFIMPLIDTSTVVINRIRKGQSPFIGGKDHTTHALAYLGLSDRQVALVFWAVTVISVLLVVLIENTIKEWTHGWTIAFTIYFFLMFMIFFRAANKAEKAKSQI